jgi:hypothetical protein
MMAASPYIAYFSNKTVCLILTEIKNPNFYVYLRDFIEKTLEVGAKIVIVDVTNYGTVMNYIPKETFYKRRVNRKKMLKYQETFRESLPKKIEFIRVQPENVQPRSSLKYRTLNALFESTNYPRELQRSIQSILITHILKSAVNTNLSRLAKRNVALMVHAFYYTLDSLNFALSSRNVDIVVSLNGRKADQAAVTYFCRTNHKEQFYFENGSTPGRRYYLAPTEPQNVVEFQEWFKKSILNKKSIEDRLLNEERAKKWFESRENNPPRFGQDLREKNFSTDDFGIRQTLGIFLSSLGEMDYLDGSLESQFQAWGELIKIIASKDETGVVIRFHPNMLNYSWNDIIEFNHFFTRTLKKRGVSKVKLIQPWADVSSYEILKKLDGLITWNSTIGLEAAYRGIPIAVLANTFYSKIIGLEPLSLERVEALNSILKKVSREKCLEACAVLLDNGEFVSEEILNSSFCKNLKKISTLDSRWKLSFLNLINQNLIKLSILFEINSAPIYLKRFVSKFFSQDQTIKVMDFALRIKMRGYEPSILEESREMV